MLFSLRKPMLRLRFAPSLYVAHSVCVWCCCLPLCMDVMLCQYYVSYLCSYIFFHHITSCALIGLNVQISAHFNLVYLFIYLLLSYSRIHIYSCSQASCVTGFPVTCLILLQTVCSVNSVQYHVEIFVFCRRLYHTSV
jgi:hypothetical protein